MGQPEYVGFQGRCLMDFERERQVLAGYVGTPRGRNEWDSSGQAGWFQVRKITISVERDQKKPGHRASIGNEEVMEGGVWQG